MFDFLLSFNCDSTPMQQQKHHIGQKLILTCSFVTLLVGNSCHGQVKQLPVFINILKKILNNTH